MSIRKIIYTSIFVALGILLPQILHLLGGLAGPVFLPMHIPTLFAGLICGPLSGLLVGMLSVLLSHILTGMPAVPMIFIMLVELMIYGSVAGVMYQKKQSSVMVALIVAMVAGRVGYGLMLFVLRSIIGIQLPATMTVWAAVVTGLPGIIIQLILVPVTMVALEKTIGRSSTGRITIK